MTLIKELINIPERIHKGDFVLRLTEGVEHAEETLRHYVVTPQLAASFDNANVIEFSNSSDISTIITDQIRLQQILMHLLSNACKFTKNWHISIAVEKKSERITISISDTGIGMSAEELSDLFCPYSQANRVTGSSYGGTGLGLALSKKLITLMKGEIQVRSEVGKGSCFKISLPV